VRRVIICRSNPIAPDPRVEKIARALDSFDYSVTLLGWDRTGQLPAADSLQTDRGVIPLNRIPLKAPFGHGLANLPNLLRWQWALFRWLSKNNKGFDLIHACDFDTILPALSCKWFFGKKIIYDIFDFYADHLRATPQFIKNLIRFVDLRAIDQADALILVDDSRWEQIKGAHPKVSAVIYNSPGVEALGENTATQAVKTFDLQPPTFDFTTLSLAYIGLLQVERGLREMLAVLKKHPAWRLDLAGFGGDEEEIRSIAVSLPNVRWHGRVPYEQALQISQAADVLFATYDPTIPNHRYSSPNKVFEAMLLGKPIVVARNTNMDRIIEQADCGLVISYGNVAELEAALLRLQNDADLRRRLGQNALEAYRTTYSWSKMETRLCKLYERILVD
jgi:glycosyltransferase involved in cell wall biosynthesis